MVMHLTYPFGSNVTSMFYKSIIISVLFVYGEWFLYHIFLHAYPLVNVVCVIYLLNCSYEFLLGLIMLRGHKDFSDHYI